jgi:6-phosphogluconolactonase
LLLIIFFIVIFIVIFPWPEVAVARSKISCSNEGCTMFRRIALVLAAVGCAFSALPAGEPAPRKLWVFVGTYTGGKSKGIYRLELDAAAGKLGEPKLAAESNSPSFLAIHPRGKFLYAVNEGSVKGKKGGGVSAFAIDRKTGGLTLLNQESSVGAGPCHLIVDAAGKHVLVANYGGGSALVLPIAADGSLQGASSFVQHEGKSVNPKRQEAPHAHSINLDKAGRFAFVADLGLDKVLIYRYDAARGTLTPNEPAAATLKPGAGPRHFAFHPSGKFAYVINELDSTLTAFDYDAGTGALRERQTLSTLPKSHPGNSTAEVVVHPSGKFVYGSNRGHNSIAVFTVDPESGKLQAAGHQGHLIKTPRNFAIEPGGRYLLVGNQAGDSIGVFAIDQATGALTPVGEPVAVPAPVCIRFLAR